MSKYVRPTGRINNLDVLTISVTELIRFARERSHFCHYQRPILFICISSGGSGCRGGCGPVAEGSTDDGAARGGGGGGCQLQRGGESCCRGGVRRPRARAHASCRYVRYIVIIKYNLICFDNVIIKIRTFLLTIIAAQAALT